MRARIGFDLGEIDVGKLWVDAYLGVAGGSQGNHSDWQEGLHAHAAL